MPTATTTATMSESTSAVAPGVGLAARGQEAWACADTLEQLVDQRTRQVRESIASVIACLSLALEAKDAWTHDHSRRVAALAGQLGVALGLNAAQCADLRLAGHLHDIGKIGVRQAVLHKPGLLTPAEYAHVKQHPDLGARILAPVQDLRPILPFVRGHHERWDGTGYPDRLAGEAIPLGARILAVADAYVALREDRPYRPGCTKQRCLTELRFGARRQFDLEVFGALLDLDQQGVLDALDQAFPQDLPILQVA
jgi:putative two-component system response regulator